ncbi:MAG TPA: NAD-dependent epimerase/dehydratase family protein [Candidatus Binatia bacterium]|nr:NAD-dependent epimerase/dehydratase family protein [Candidatus Binatia bacterium]
MKVLVIGGTGPTGVPIVRRLVDGGHAVTILHRGTHERAETPAAVAHLHADPFDERSLIDALHGTTWDAIAAMYGRLRRVAAVTAGRCAHLVSVGGVPAYRGWTAAWQHDPPGLPVPTAEDADLVRDPAIDDKGYRIVRTEQAVFALHPGAAHFRYPYLYGPYQPAPREWCVVRRILDGRRRIVVADDGLTLHHHCYTENAAAAVVRAIEHPELSAGRIFNVGDEEVLTVRQVVELCAGALGAELEVVSLPHDLAVPARPLVAQPLPTHRVLDLGRLHHQLGHRDVVPAREAVRATARWLAANPPARGGIEEKVLTDPFDYAAEDALVDAWLAARESVRVPEFAVRPGFGLAYSGPEGRPRMHEEFVE